MVLFHHGCQLCIKMTRQFCEPHLAFPFHNKGMPHLELRSVAFLVFNIYSIISATIYALVMNIVAINCAIITFLMIATCTLKIDIIAICDYHPHTLAFRTFDLYPGFHGTIYTILKIGFINCAAHSLPNSFLSNTIKIYYILCFFMYIVNASLYRDSRFTTSKTKNTCILQNSDLL